MGLGACEDGCGRAEDAFESSTRDRRRPGAIGRRRRLCLVLLCRPLLAYGPDGETGEHEDEQTHGSQAIHA